MGEDLYDESLIDYQDAKEQLIKAIYRGRLPLLTQELNAYDTVQGILELEAVRFADDEEDAFFDLALSLVGWIPGPGQDLKLILRAINRAPQRHARSLFDLIRYSLEACRIKTSPEQLLEKTLDAQRLRDDMLLVQQVVEQSRHFLGLTPQQQTMVRHNLNEATGHSGFLIQTLQERIDPWVAVQRNSSGADTGSQEPARFLKPQSQQRPGALPGAGASDGAKTTQSLNQGSEGSGNWLELNLHYGNLEPVSGAAYRVIFSDGSERQGSLDDEGFARLEDVPFGPAKVYYGEDPRPYHRLPLQIVEGDVEQLREELDELGLDLDETDLAQLFEETSGRRAPFTPLIFE